MGEITPGLCLRSNDSRDGHRSVYWVVSVSNGRATLEPDDGGRRVMVSLHRIFDDGKSRLYGWSVVPDAGERPHAARFLAPDRKRHTDMPDTDDLPADASWAEESTSETFGERLRRLRIASGLTVEQIAQCIGVTHSIIRRVENGEHQIRAHRMPDLARRLGCTTDYLLTGREPDDVLRNAILRGTRPEILLAMAKREL